MPARHEGREGLADFDFDKQVQAVHVQFTPERERLSNKTYTRALVDSDDLEWIELSADAKDSDPAQGEEGGGTTPGEDESDNPMA